LVLEDFLKRGRCQKRVDKLFCAAHLMFDFSQLELFASLDSEQAISSLDRRSLLKGGVPAALLPLGIFNRSRTKEKELEIPDDPLAIVRKKRLPTLTAMIEAQVDVLWCGSHFPRDSACEIVKDILVYMSSTPDAIFINFHPRAFGAFLTKVKHHEPLGFPLHTFYGRKIICFTSPRAVCFYLVVW